MSLAGSNPAPSATAYSHNYCFRIGATMKIMLDGNTVERVINAVDAIRVESGNLISFAAQPTLLSSPSASFLTGSLLTQEPIDWQQVIRQSPSSIFVSPIPGALPGLGLTIGSPTRNNPVLNLIPATQDL